MADGPKIQGEVSLSTEGVESALNRVAAAGETMATRLQQGADKAGKAVDGIGSGAAASVEQFTRAESRMNDAIQRQITSLQLLGKTASQKLEFKIDAQGLDPAKFEPMLVKLREAEKQAAASSTAVSASLNKMGMSAAATATAMRGVPAQMTDIIVSLQSGQAPLTVLMQQGGQLKDMFGGVGNAAKAMGSYIAGMVNPLTLTAAAAGALGYAFYAGSEESKKLAQSLTLTGNAAGQSVGSLYKMADAIAATTGATKGAAVDALSQVMATGKVAADNLSLVAEAAVTMERATGTAVKDTVAQFSELGRSPVHASVKLNEQYGYLTASVYAQIKALEEQGKTQEAVALAQTTFANSLEGMSSRAVENVGYIERAWRGVKDAIKSAGDALLNVGREDTLEKQLEKAIARRDGGYDYSAKAYIGGDKSAEAANAVDVIQKQIAARDMLAKYEAESLATEKQKIAQIDAAGKLREKYQTKEQQRAKEIEAIEKSILTDKEKASAIALVNEKYKEKAVSVAGTKDDVSQTYSAQLSAEKSFAATQIALVKERVAQRVRTEEEGAQDVVIIEQAALEREKAILTERLKLTTDKGERAKIKQQIEEIGSASEVSVQKYVTAITKLNDARAKAMNDALAGYNASTSKISDENDQLREQIDMLGMTSQQVGEYEASKIRAAAAAEYLDAANLREAASTMEAAGIAADSVKYYRDLADAREAAGKALSDKATLTTQKGIKQSAIEAEKEWKATADKIGDSITDALMRGFESGKSFAVTLRDTVVNMFKTMVLQPIVKATVVGGLNAVGLGSSSSFAGTAGSASNLASAGNTAYSLYNGGYSSLYSSAATSSVGQALGLGTTVYDATADTLATGLTSFGSTVGTAIPYIGAAIAAVSLLTSALGKRGGAKTEGDAYGTLSGTSLSLAATDRTGDNWITGSNSNAVVESLLQPIGTSVANLIKSMGGNANGLSFNLGFSTDTKGTAKDNIQSGVMDAAGNYVYRNGRNAERGTYSTELQLETQRMMVAAVKAADVSQVYKDIAGSVDLYSASAEQLQTVLGQLAQVTTLRTAFDTLGLGADKLTSALITAAGGASALSTNVESYYSNFYSDSERQANALKQVSDSMAGLGLTMPTTREGFRALVEAQDLTTDSGQKTFAALMGLNSAFAAVVPATKDASEAISETMKSLQAKTADLKIELLAAQGLTVAAARAQREIDIKGMTAAEVAVYDYNASLRKQIDALNAAKEASESAAEAAKEAADLEKSRADAERARIATMKSSAQTIVDDIKSKFSTLSGTTTADTFGLSASEVAANQSMVDALNAATAGLTSLGKIGLDKKVLDQYTGQLKAIIAKQTKVLAVTVMKSRTMAGDVAGALASALSTVMPSITDAIDANGKFVAANFNHAMEDAQAKAAVMVGAYAAPNALSVENYQQFAGLGAVGSISSDYIGIASARSVSESDYGTTNLPSQYALRSIVAGMIAEYARTNGRDTTGMNGIYAARSDAQYLSTLPDRIKYANQSVAQLNKEFEAGQLSASQLAAGMEFVNSAMSGVTTTAGKFVVPSDEEFAAMQAAANDAIRAAGYASLKFYFGKLDGLVGDLAEAAKAASTPLAQVNSAIGLLKSAATVFGQSAAAATLGAEAAVGSDAGKAQTIADAAAKAADLLTTQTAKTVQSTIALSDAFKSMSDSQRRDVSLMLDGIGAFDNTAFYESFLKLSDALKKGAIDTAQYSELYQIALDKTIAKDTTADDAAAKAAAEALESANRAAEQAAKDQADAAQQVATVFENLRKAAQGLTDSLTVDSTLSTLSPNQRIAEAATQYYDNLSAAMSGDADAVSNFQTAAKTYLNVLHENAQDASQYRDGFDTVIRNDAIVVRASPDKDKNAALLEEIKALKGEIVKLKASQESTALSCDRSARALQQIVEEGIVPYQS